MLTVCIVLLRVGFWYNLFPGWGEREHSAVRFEIIEYRQVGREGLQKYQASHRATQKWPLLNHFSDKLIHMRATQYVHRVPT